MDDVEICFLGRAIRPGQNHNVSGAGRRRLRFPRQLLVIVEFRRWYTNYHVNSPFDDAADGVPSAWWSRRFFLPSEYSVPDYSSAFFPDSPDLHFLDFRNVFSLYIAVFVQFKHIFIQLLKNSPINLPEKRNPKYGALHINTERACRFSPIQLPHSAKRLRP
ncbi:MAG: hypothetical protein ACI4PV_01955 [Butyricicoccus sp.]